MEEGQGYRFAWDPSSGRFRTGPDDLENWPDLAGAANGPRLASTGTGLGQMVEKSLPDGVRFLADPSGGSSAGDAIIFQPNGTAQILAANGTDKAETEVVFADRGGQMRALRIRGLTGVVSVESVR
jgi:hypothetical protein